MSARIGSCRSGRRSPRLGLGCSFLAAALAPSLLLCGCSSAAPRGPGFPPLTGLRLEQVIGGLDHPVHLTAPRGDPRLFIVEQGGTIRIVENGRLLARPFLDLSSLVSTDHSERGLLSLTFHPDYASNGLFFVNYTDRSGDSRVVRYTVSADSNLANPATAKPIFFLAKPYPNHNGGYCLFGTDGMFYIGTGDGGSGGDPQGNGQNLGTLAGKLLRIDVDHGDPYGIPSDNPFVGRPGARPEIWAYGLRNPWRFWFDQDLLYVADVGQNEWEEVDVVDGRGGGLNFGWNTMEGNHCYRERRCSSSGLVVPSAEYGHSSGCSITGGLVYRGTRVPSLVGHYVYADYCTGFIRSFRFTGGQVTEHRQWRLGERPPVASFGTDDEGELYVVSHDGRIFRVAGE